MHELNKIEPNLKFQASIEGLGTYSLWMGHNCICIHTYGWMALCMNLVQNSNPIEHTLYQKSLLNCHCTTPQNIFMLPIFSKWLWMWFILIWVSQVTCWAAIQHLPNLSLKACICETLFPSCCIVHVFSLNYNKPRSSCLSSLSQKSNSSRTSVHSDAEEVLYSSQAWPLRHSQD